MKKILNNILHDSCSSHTTAIIRMIFNVCEIGFRSIVAVRNFLYDRNLLMPKTVQCRIISIGNLTLGGTGKTPLVIMTAQLLQSHGYSVAVVSRGYRAKVKTPLVVSDGVKVIASSYEAGDEPHIIAHTLQGIPVVVGRNRIKAVHLALNNFHPDVIILDDGMQHRKLYRDKDVVVLRCDNPFGNGHLLPRGILREPPSSLSRAHAVVVTHCYDEQSRQTIEKKVHTCNHHVPVFFAHHIPAGLRRPFKNERIEYENIRGKMIAVLSNIAYPESFYQLVDSFGVVIVWKCAYEDHHRCTKGELKEVEEEAVKRGAKILIMTAKDERNLPDSCDVQTIEKLVLDISIDFVQGSEEYLQILKS